MTEQDTGLGYMDVESDFETFEAGEYIVRFKEWFPLDDQGLPILKDQERFGKLTLVARYRTLLENDMDGPPGSIRARLRRRPGRHPRQAGIPRYA